jgi:glycosyltransferase involved in cell wall biosynthesis
MSRVLAALEAQTLPRNHWELIFVDNASAERLDGRLDLRWHPAGRVVRENDLGLTPARLRAIRESRGDVLIFVDDDNVLAPDYLATATDVARTHSFLGAWSGHVTGEFEVPPPEWTRRYWGNLVIREVTRDAWSNIHGLDVTTPLGAGLCVRREAATEYLRVHDSGLRPKMLDRAGTSLVSGGDNDLSACALDIGLGWGVIASLRLTHLIPKERLSEEYLLRLVEAVAYSSLILRSFRAEASDGASPSGLASRAAGLARKIRMSRRERRFHAAVTRGETRAREELGRA